MKRVLVWGSAGSGKSTLAKELGQRLGLPVIHMDRLFWLPGWVQPDPAPFKRKVSKAAGGKTWVIEGNYRPTMAVRLRRADTVIFVDLPRWLCLLRATWRSFKSRGKERPDCAEGCREQLMTWTFFVWIWKWHSDSRQRYVEMIEEARGTKRVIVLKSPEEVKRFLETV